MKTIDSVTNTEGLQTTQMLIAGFTIVNEHSQDAAAVLADELTKDEQNDPERWYALAQDDEDSTYACTGTVDLEMYVKVEYPTII